MDSIDPITYQIDSRDCIIWVNEAWDRFAARNDGQAVQSKVCFGRPIWDFITGYSTQRVYRELVKNAREGQGYQFRLRCDSPELERLLVMTIAPLPQGVVEFQTTALSVRPGKAFLPWVPDASEDPQTIRQCGWCSRVLHEGFWIELATALNTVELFETYPTRSVLHDICPDCHAGIKPML